MAKYRVMFVEESTEHLADMSAAMLELEKNMASSEAIDVIFRMAHSIKGMAASMQYDAITETAHALEDRVQDIRAVGSVGSDGELAQLFSGLEDLEAMVATVRDGGESPSPTAAASQPLTSAAPKKKLLSPMH